MTATEVTSDNSALMRNIRRHENSLGGSIVSIAKAIMHASRSFGEGIPDEGEVRVQFDDSIQDAAAEKERDMREAGVTMGAWEYRMRWYGEEESTARARAAEIGTEGARGPRVRRLAGGRGRSMHAILGRAGCSRPSHRPVEPEV